MKKLMLMLVLVFGIISFMGIVDSAWNSELTTGLIGYWTLNGTSGLVNDSYTDVDGTNFGASRGATGKIDNAFDFESGDNADFITFGNVYNFEYDGTFSANAWINAETTASDETIMSKMDRDSPFAGWQMRMQSNNEIEFGYITSQGGNEKTITTTTPHINSTGIWYMVTITYDNENMKIYINGNPVEVSVETDTLTSSFGNSLIDFNIGNRDNNSQDDQDFDGLIDEVGIWNVTLSEYLVSSLWNSGSGLTFDISLQAPNGTINSPIGALTSNNVTFNFTAVDDGTLDWCSYNVTTSGLGVIVAENKIDCSNLIEYQTISDGVGYIVNFFVNDTLSDSNTTTQTFSIDTTSVVIAGGGGGVVIRDNEGNAIAVDVCSPYKEEFEKVLQESEGEEIFERIKLIWDAFWDSVLCDSASAIVPIQ